MLKEVLLLNGENKGLQLREDGFTEAEHKRLAEKKEKMKIVYDGRTYVGRCKICKGYIWEHEKFFYFENKDGLGNLFVDVEHTWH